VPDEVLAAGLDSQQLGTLRKKGFIVRQSSAGLVRLAVPNGLGLDAAAAHVLQVNPAAQVDANHYYYTAGDLSPCEGALCAATAAIKWPAPADRCGAPAAVIGVVDTAIRLDDPALQGRSVEALPGGARSNVGSGSAHGTLVASVLVGLLPNARIVAVDAFEQDPAGRQRTDAMTLAAAIETLRERGVRVINLSLEGPKNSVLGREISEASKAGIVLVAAAGNGGAKAEPTYPAAYDEVLSVTAVDADLNLYRRASTGSFVDIAAPGVDVVGGPGVSLSGTSFAVPFVTGAAALLASAEPDWTPARIEADLKSKARDLGAPGRDDLFGYGLLQAGGLCNAASPLVASGEDTGVPAVDRTGAEGASPARSFSLSGE
jgi:subtilisin family serine protease